MAGFLDLLVPRDVVHGCVHGIEAIDGTLLKGGLSGVSLGGGEDQSSVGLVVGDGVSSSLGESGGGLVRLFHYAYRWPGGAKPATSDRKFLEESMAVMTGSLSMRWQSDDGSWVPLGGSDDGVSSLRDRIDGLLQYSCQRRRLEIKLFELLSEQGKKEEGIIKEDLELEGVPELMIQLRCLGEDEG